MIVFPDYERCRKRAIFGSQSRPLRCAIVGRHETSITHELLHRWGGLSSLQMTERQLADLFGSIAVTFDDLGEDQ